MTPFSSLLLVPVLGLITGILCGRAGLESVHAGIFLALAAGIYFAVGRFTRNPVKGYMKNRWHYLWIYILFIGVGICSFSADKPYNPNKEISRIFSARGQIEEISTTNFGDKAIVKVQSVMNEENKIIDAPGWHLLLRTDVLGQDIDDIVIFPVSLKEIKDSRNFFNTGYAEYLKNKGISYQTECKGTEIVKAGHDMTLKGTGIKIRRHLETVIEKSPLSTTTSNFLITILLGDRTFLGSETRDLFADAGVSHILALSGMHVAIIASMLLFVLIPFNISGHYRVRLILCPVILLFYAFITGWAPSTVRAVLMMSALCLGMLLERKNNAWNSLLFATLIILLFQPAALFDPGFQLSFTCVASLIFFATQLNPVNHHEHPRLYKTAALIIATIVATAATWCVASYYFGKLPVMFFPANILILPLLPVYLGTAIIYLVLYGVGIDFTWIKILIDWFPSMITEVISLLTSDAKTAVSFTISGYSVIAWLILLLGLALYINSPHKRRWAFVSCTCGLIFVCSFIISPGQADKGGLIIQSHPLEFKILTRQNGRDMSVTIPRYKNTFCTAESCDFLFIDSKEFKLERKTINPLIVVLGNNIPTDIQEILVRLRPDKVIIHPTMRKKKEKQIIHILDSMNIMTHSIRLQGPFHIQN